MGLNSIRGRLTLLLLSSVFLLIVVAAVATWVIVRSRILREFDRVLAAEARGLMVLTAREGDSIEADFGDWEAAVQKQDDEEDEGANGDDGEDEAEEEEDGEEQEADAYYQLYLADGTVVRKSKSLGPVELPYLKGEEGVAFRNVELPGGDPGRMVQLTFLPEEDEPEPDEVVPPDELLDLYELPEAFRGKPVKLVLVVARDREHLEELLASLALTMGGLGLLLAGAMALTIRVAVGRGFRPLDTFSEQVRAIGPDSLDQRVNLPAPPTELEGAVTALNGLLERVEEGFERERRFSSDVAHELRTPLAELLAACEVGAKWPEDAEATRQLFDDLHGSATHLHRIVNTLLQLSQCENGAHAIVKSRIGIKQLVEECWDRARIRAGGKHMEFEGLLDGELAVESDPDRLRMIVQNLIDNAVLHGDEGSKVVCESLPGPVPIVRLSNGARDLSKRDTQHIFDRFWQKDSARSASDHSGLGLSIVKALCDLLGIEVQAQLAEGDRFEVSLLFRPANRT